MSFIEDFYNGNIYPMEKGFNHNPQYVRSLRRCDKLKQKLTEMLSDEELKIFNEFYEESGIMGSAGELESFKLGFRLGVQMLCDSLTDV